MLGIGYVRNDTGLPAKWKNRGLGLSPSDLPVKYWPLYPELPRHKHFTTNDTNG